MYVLGFKILIIAENLFGLHTGTKKFKNAFHRIAQSANTGLTMAYFSIYGNTLQEIFHTFKLQAGL